MRGLFTKIFLGFWIAQSLTFSISTMLIVRRRFVRPNEIMEVLNSTLPATIKTAVDAYETGGCEALDRYAATLRQTIYLTDSAHNFLCARLTDAEAAAALTVASNSRGVRITQTDK